MPEKTSRNTRLRIWLMERDIAMRTVAAQLGMTRQRLCFLLNSPTITPYMHGRLVDVGLPSHLLPPVAERRYGPGKSKGVLCLNPATAS